MGALSLLNELKESVDSSRSIINSDKCFKTAQIMAVLAGFFATVFALSMSTTLNLAEFEISGSKLENTAVAVDGSLISSYLQLGMLGMDYAIWLFMGSFLFIALGWVGKSNK